MSRRLEKDVVSSATSPLFRAAFCLARGGRQHVEGLKRKTETHLDNLHDTQKAPRGTLQRGEGCRSLNDDPENRNEDIRLPRLGKQVSDRLRNEER